LLVLAACWLLAPGAHALTITVNGTAGAAGAGVDGGPGGPADAPAVSGDATNFATANGGLGGSSTGATGGDGGAATANAETNVGVPATAHATANGGRGGNATGAGGAGGDGGDATSEAHATGTGGSVARAIATGGNGGNVSGGALLGGAGGDAMLDGVVSGSDSTVLVLEQSATGGDGGGGIVGGGIGLTGGAGGDATSLGDFTNAAGGDLSVTLNATAGGGGFGDTSGEGGDAQVGGSATSSGAGDASLLAIVRSGSGSVAGALTIDPLVATAGGSGDASVELAATIGDTRGPFTELASPFLSLADRVDANAGPGARIALVQSASSSGGAESTLDVTKSAALLDVEANAAGGVATIGVRGSNDAGDLQLSGQAIGGDESFLTGDPFDAFAVFEAETSGDGHDIEIGSASRPAGAIGGTARDPGALEIRGGAADVLANATALGNSAVRIDVTAEGGRGSELQSGDATVSAEGNGGGAESVDVKAAALGRRELYSIGGNADAEAIAHGLGAVSALAIAQGGVHDGSGPGGAGFARALASGASGSVEAIASTATLFDGEDADDEQIGTIEVGLAASVAGESSVVASSQRGGFAPGSDDAAFDGFVRSAYQPDAGLLAAAVAGNPLAAAAPPPQDDTELISLVELGATSSGGIARSFTATITIGEANGFGEYDDVPEGIVVSFLDPELDAAAFGALTLRSWDASDPADLYEITFASALDALGFLDDGRLLFVGQPTLRHLEISFETTGAEGAFFLDLIVSTVPEPSALALLALAALALRAVVASRPS
jgi:hypothetical protein